MALEKPVVPLRWPLEDFGPQYAASAFVAFLFAASGPVAIILSVGARGGLSESDIASWIFAAFCLNSVISLAFTLAYRQPLVFLWSIPGAVLVGPALGHLSFPEVIGAFVGKLLLDGGQFPREDEPLGVERPSEQGADAGAAVAPGDRCVRSGISSSLRNDRMLGRHDAESARPQARRRREGRRQDR